MFKQIKSEIVGLLEEKAVSLAMIFDDSRRILWKHGRNIAGRDIREGDGFCKSYIEESLKNKKWIEQEYALIESKGKSLSRSAEKLAVKKVVIQPINNHLFLYIDSGRSEESFSQCDITIFKIIGNFLKHYIEQAKESKSVDRLIGNTNIMKKIREDLPKFAMEESTLLVTGETGTGKNHVAELIHRYSGRKGELKVISAPSIPENLFESELFGHRKGAFTDAREDRPGILESADGGTILIDEISEIPITIQAKLLRLLDKKKYTVLGETEEREANVRIIAATNKNLKEAIKKGEFRRDLFHRLEDITIEIPPLRERKEDIREFLLVKRNLIGKKEIGEGFWEVMFSYSWPGNVRELINVLKNLGRSRENIITGEVLKKIINISDKEEAEEKEKTVIENIREQFKRGKDFWEVIRKPYLNRDLNNDQVRQIIKSGLLQADNSLKELTKSFNINSKKEHERVVKFLHKHHLR